MDSILTSIKKLLGIAEEYVHFDTDIIMHINSVFGTLTQIGVGPSSGFVITDKYAVWNDFIQDEPNFEMLKIYVYQKVKLRFDPPSSSAHLQALKESISETEWRLNIAAETTSTSEKEA